MEQSHYQHWTLSRHSAELWALSIVYSCLWFLQALSNRWGHSNEELLLSLVMVGKYSRCSLLSNQSYSKLSLNPFHQESTHQGLPQLVENIPCWQLLTFSFCFWERCIADFFDDHLGLSVSYFERFILSKCVKQLKLFTLLL